MNNPREILIILRRNSNIIDIKELREADNQIIHINSIAVEEYNKGRDPLMIEDYKIIGDRIVLNFQHRYIYLFGVEDLLRQNTAVLDHGLCAKLDHWEIYNEEGIFKI